MTIRLSFLAAALAAALPAFADPAQFGGAGFVEPGGYPAPSLVGRSFVAGAGAPLAAPIAAPIAAPAADLAARRLLSPRGHASGRPASHVSPGEAQLAASLGVDPAAFTWAELARLKSLRERCSDED